MTCLVAVLAMPYALSPLTPMSMLERPAGHAGFLVLEPVALSVPLGSILRFRGCGGRNLCQEIDAGFIVATVALLQRWLTVLVLLRMPFPLPNTASALPNRPCSTGEESSRRFPFWVLHDGGRTCKIHALRPEAEPRHREPSLPT